LSVENYLTGEKIISNGESVPLTLPKENVVKYRLTNESWIAFRPSGTEPKMKIYLGVCADTEKLANEKLTYLDKQINELIKKEISKKFSKLFFLIINLKG